MAWQEHCQEKEESHSAELTIMMNHGLYFPQVDIEELSGMNRRPGTSDFGDRSASISSRSHKRDTKPEAPLFTVHRGRSTPSWMGRIRYVEISRAAPAAEATKRTYLLTAIKSSRDVIVCVASAQTHLAQSEHCVMPPHSQLYVAPSVSMVFQQRLDILRLLPAPHSPLYISLSGMFPDRLKPTWKSTATDKQRPHSFPMEFERQANLWSIYI